MSRLSRRAEAFIDKYANEYPQIHHATQMAESVVRSVLQDAGLDVLITSRTKHSDSVRAKLRRKSYRDPTRQLTDTSGIRVITHYRSQISPVVDVLSEEFEVNKANSIDRRRALHLREFEYTSVHLIVRLKGSRARMAEYGALVGQWFEIQIRSILEHAWAEIEHQVVYKSGIRYPDGIVRRFAALAGVLELLDDEFVNLKGERDKLVDHFRKRYSVQKDGQRIFDVARLLGFLEAERPHGLSWRKAEESEDPFPPKIGVSCVDALRSVGLKSANSFRAMMSTRRFRSAVRSFAASHDISPVEISHLAVAVIAVAIKDADMLRTHFPEMIRHPSVAHLLK